MMESIFNSAVLESTGQKTKVKNYSDTYVYHVGVYEKELFEFIMKSERIDKKDPVYEDLKVDLKKQRTAGFLLNVLESDKTVLCTHTKSLPRSFKTFCAKDVKGNGELKLFIDITGLITLRDGAYSYQSNDLHIISSYLLGGSYSMIYFAAPTTFYNRNSLINYGARCFSSLVYHIIDYLRIGGTAYTGKIKYMAAKYFQLNIVTKPMADSVENLAKTIAGVSETDVSMVELMLDKHNPYKDIKTFIEGIAIILKSEDLTLDVFMDKWMYHFGVGTQFATELFPAFVNMMVYAYVGAYLNNQKTIEKCLGRDLVNFNDEITKIGTEVIK